MLAQPHLAYHLVSLRVFLLRHRFRKAWPRSLSDRISISVRSRASMHHCTPLHHHAPSCTIMHSHLPCYSTRQHLTTQALPCYSTRQHLTTQAFDINRDNQISLAEWIAGQVRQEGGQCRCIEGRASRRRCQVPGAGAGAGARARANWCWTRCHFQGPAQAVLHGGAR